MTDGGGAPIRTVTDDARLRFHRIETRVRIVGVVAMALVVTAAALGLLGPRETTSSVHGAPGTLEVTLPQLTRAGLDAHVLVEVDDVEAGRPVRLLVDSALLETLGIITVQPTPDSERARDGAVEYEFLPAGEPPYEIRLSGRVPTKAVPTRLEWSLALLPSEGDHLTHEATTWVLP